MTYSHELIDAEYYLMLLVWLFGPAFVFVLHSRRGKLAGILLYSYIYAFFIVHWPGAVVHASPWSNLANSSDTISGFRLSTYGLLALLLGAVLLPTSHRSRHIRINTHVINFGELNERQYHTARILLVIGIASWIMTYTPIIHLPSMASILSAGKQCSLLALCLFCWLAWRRGSLAQFGGWLALACTLPVITVITSGFIGYGIAMLGTVLMFVAMFYRPRWLIFLGIFVGIYVGLGLWVAYASKRIEIRSAVWGGQSIDARAGALSNVIDVFQLFDFRNQKHLETVDLRLNQNLLVGAAIRITPEYEPFLEGETFFYALIAVIPRAIWPDKPASGGSGDYVSKHTKIEFAAGTSVGMGQVLELYINFGMPAVIIGFLLLGMGLRRLDIGVIDGIERGDYRRVQFYFLIGAGALQAGGSLSEIASSMAGGLVMSYAISTYLDRTGGLQKRKHTSIHRDRLMVSSK